MSISEISCEMQSKIGKISYMETVKRLFRDTPRRHGDPVPLGTCASQDGSADAGGGADGRSDRPRVLRHRLTRPPDPVVQGTEDGNKIQIPLQLLRGGG